MYVLYRHSRGRYVSYTSEKCSVYFSIMEKTHIEIETNIMGKECVLYICNHTIICHRDCPPAVCLAEGLADNHRGKRKIRAVWTVAQSVLMQFFLCTVQFKKMF